MTAGQVRVSYADYLALEAKSERKHEYLRGQAWAMAGGTVEHGRLQVNVAVVLQTALQGKPCVVLSSDVKVRVEGTDRTTYPDASVVFGPRQTSPLDRHAIVNPVVLVEVLSESTEGDDRGEKLAHYRRLPSLEEYVLVSQEARRIEVFRRTPEGWMLVEAGPGQHVELRSLGVSLSVDAIYFDPAA